MIRQSLHADQRKRVRILPLEDASYNDNRWIHNVQTAVERTAWLLREARRLLDDMDAVANRVAAGERLPLAGVPVLVKDNINVTGTPTTCGSRRAALISTEDTSHLRVGCASRTVADSNSTASPVIRRGVMESFKCESDATLARM